MGLIVCDNVVTTTKEVQKMYFYNICSSQKIIHLSDCRYITNSTKKQFGHFYGLKEALKKGYRPCRHCFTVAGRFAEEKERIDKYCRRYNYIISQSNNTLEITTGRGEWKIVQAEHSQRTELYHKNTQTRDSDRCSRIEGYHNQRVTEYELVDYIHYIARHDGSNQKVSKGTKRYKNMQKKLAAQAKRQSVCNVLYLIDSLQMSRAV